MTLFVGHLNERIKEKNLQELFQEHGSILSIDRKGTYAFIEYDDRSNASRAAEALDKIEFMGTRLRVELSNRERGVFGPPPGDLSETCYNCQQIGHIAKNCPHPPQPSQVLHLQKTQPHHQQQYSQQSLYEQAPYQKPLQAMHGGASRMSRVSKREGFLDSRHPKFRLGKHGHPRIHAKPYPLAADEMGGAPYRLGKKKKLSGEALPHASTRSQHPRPISPAGLAVPVHANAPVLLDHVLFPGAQSMMATSVTSIAGEMHPATPRYPDGSAYGHAAGSSSAGYHSAELPLGATGRSPAIGMPFEGTGAGIPEPAYMYPPGPNGWQLVTPAHVQAAHANKTAAPTVGQTYSPPAPQIAPTPQHALVHQTQPPAPPLSQLPPPPANLPAPGAPTVENPYLPPGTLVYMPMYTVLPTAQLQQQQKQVSSPLHSQPMAAPRLPPPPPPHQPATAVLMQPPPLPMVHSSGQPPPLPPPPLPAQTPSKDATPHYHGAGGTALFASSSGGIPLKTWGLEEAAAEIGGDVKAIPGLDERADRRANDMLARRGSAASSSASTHWAPKGPSHQHDLASTQSVDTARGGGTSRPRQSLSLAGDHGDRGDGKRHNM